MKKLKDILYQVKILRVVGDTDIAINEVTFDSRKVSSGSLFVAQSGTQVDGHLYIGKALECGASAIVCEVLPAELDPQVTYILTDDSLKATGVIASNFYDNPSHLLKVVGVTGTNGKTTVATLLYALFSRLGYKCGLISTIEYRIADQIEPSTHTTPDAITLQKYFRRMLDLSCEFCFIEVSSHSLTQGRVAGVEFASASFTNLTLDHLDYHGTMENYFQAKKMLFDNLTNKSFAVINMDSKYAEEIVSDTKAKVITYGLSASAEYKGRVLEAAFDHTLMKVNHVELFTQLVGDFNASNVLNIYAVAMQFHPIELDVLREISVLKSAKGRFDFEINRDGIKSIVDYSHTPDALFNILSTINKLRTRNEKLITVVGCGGDRDKSKRPEMARIAVAQCDKVILTSDNPRTEDPMQILEDMKQGVDKALERKVLIIEDRRTAIQTACMMASADDIILVAGKGHEDYQEIQGVKYPFDDKLVLKEFLN